jgi:hypothetical protein
MGSKLYPNMYVIFVAPPGVGKTEVTWRIRDMWTSLEDHFVGSTSVTKASMMDELAAANRRVITTSTINPVDHFNSLLVCINELGVLLPAYENEFMNTLTDLWDCKHYSEKKRTAKLSIEIENPQLNLVAACTPSYLNNFLPEGAWDQGFMARTVLVYSGERQLTTLFGERLEQKELAAESKRMMEEIANLYGEIRVSPESAALLEAFHAENIVGSETAPDHPKLVSYTIRRTVHLLKLSTIASVSRSSELLIREEDVKRAIGWLFEVEQVMPDIFKAMSSSGTGKVMEETWYYIYKTYSKEQKPVLKHRLIQFLQERVPVHNIEVTIKLMEQAKMIQKVIASGGSGYKPLGKRTPNAF